MNHHPMLRETGIGISPTERLHRLKRKQPANGMWFARCGVSCPKKFSERLSLSELLGRIGFIDMGTWWTEDVGLCQRCFPDLAVLKAIMSDAFM